MFISDRQKKNTLHTSKTARTYIHRYIHTYIDTYTYTYTHTHTYMFTLTYLNTHIHTYILEYMHTYIHTYIQDSRITLKSGRRRRNTAACRRVKILACSGQGCESCSLSFQRSASSRADALHDFQANKALHPLSCLHAVCCVYSLARKYIYIYIYIYYTHYSCRRSHSSTWAHKSFTSSRRLAQ
jgi:hypothetical protein